MTIAAGRDGGTLAPTVDPLYPEPSGLDRWVAEQPMFWLGPRSSRAGQQNLGQLAAARQLSLDEAALLALLVRQRASVLVIAAGSGAGKTTLLEALLPWYPAGDRRIRLRGSFEDFAWEHDRRFDPGRAVLVAEEISGHLPTYLWGPPVARFLGFRGAGSALIATAHGDRVEDVARLLTGYPRRLPIGAVAAFDLVVRLGHGVASRRAPAELSAVWAPSQTVDGGLTVATLADGDGLRRQETEAILDRLGSPGTDVDQALDELRQAIAPTT